MSKFLLFWVHITFLAVLCCAVPSATVSAQETDFDKWTQADVNEIAGYVKKLLTDLRSSTDAARSELLARTLAALGKIAANEEVKPAVRYNAVLIIGQLVQKEAEASGTPPVPYSAALPYLIETYQNEKMPEYIRVGALLGIVRHAYCGIADQNRQTVTDLLIKAVMSGKPAEGETSQGSREVIDWSRRTALEGLGALKTADAKVVDTLLNIMEGEKDSFDMRTLAAKTFGDLDLKDAAAKVDGAKIGKALLTLTKSFFDGEFVKVTELRELFKPEIRRDREEKEDYDAMVAEAKRLGRPVPPQQKRTRVDAARDLRLENDADYKTLPLEQKEAVREMITEIKMSLQNIRYGITGAVTGNKATAGIRSVLQDDNEVAVKLDFIVKGIDLFSILLDEGPPLPPEKKTPATTKTQASKSSSKSKSRGGGVSEEEYDRQQEARMSGGSWSSSGRTADDDKEFKVNLSIIQKGLRAVIAALESGKEFPNPLVEPVIEKPLR